MTNDTTDLTECGSPTVSAPADKSGISRRKFLKILGTASAAAGVAGCADSPSQNVLPFVKADNEQIPGVSVWYRSTCTECSAGCGIQVKTREGRAIKIEGNKAHPVNRGGLCALGQASLQHHYDPDRIRQPLQKDVDGSFKPISWQEAYTRIGDALKDATTKKVFVSGDSTDSLDDLIGEFSEAFEIERAVWDITQPVSVAKASELAFGTYGIPTYSFEKAEVILNFGADFLETWVSPCEYARGWASGKRAEHPVRFIHVEPRLSLTGANADLWLSANPGTEVKLALMVLKLLLEKGKGTNLRGDIRSKIEAGVAALNLDDVATETGVSKDKILLVANYLSEAKSSIVMAGGTAASTNAPLPLLLAVNFLNSVLQNVGNTVNVGQVRKPKTSLAKLKSQIDSMNKGEVALLFVHGTNPAYTLPSSYDFVYAAKHVPLVVSFSSHLDETAQLATLILPSSSSLESWGDMRPLSGVNGLVQPAMSPIFDTKAAGDMLLDLAKSAGNQSLGGGSKDFLAYLKENWKKWHASAGVGGDFNQFWLKSVEQGGYFRKDGAESRVKIEVSGNAFGAAFESAQFDRKELSGSDLIVFPFPSVKSFDGRAANRPWLQELPDPITTVAWDGWAELHPDTAKRLGISQGDFVTVRNHYGEVNFPAYITPYVHRSVVAIPMGQGHSSYGRFAKKVGGGNVLELIPPVQDAASDSVPLLSTRARVFRGRGKAELVMGSGSFDQGKRELARTAFVGSTHAAAAHNAHGAGAHGAGSHGAGDHGGDGHHEPKQMYVQREHPFHRWGLSIDLAACTGCSACVVACYAENNIPVVGKKVMWQGREMSWLQIQPYFDGTPEELTVNFLPLMCQHCGNAPCEPVCPVYATYHNEEGLNSMVYNRCVGTRYCANNCSYKVRRFNWFEYDWPEPLSWQLNPDVTRRTMGVMEKCTFCVQRINHAKDIAKDEGRPVRDGEVEPACAQSCPTQAIVFGNLNDPNSRVSKLAKHPRAYKVLDHHLNTQPSVSYLEDIKYKI